MRDTSFLGFPEDQLEAAFPGRVIIHELRIRGRDQLSVAIQALTCLQSLGASLDAFHLNRSAEGALHYRLKMRGVTSRQARVMAETLADLDGIDEARVEHHLICA